MNIVSLAGIVATAAAIAALAAVGYWCVRFLLSPENLWALLASLSMCY
jgi:hypothetical protein